MLKIRPIFGPELDQCKALNSSNLGHSLCLNLANLRTYIGQVQDQILGSILSYDFGSILKPNFGFNFWVNFGPKLGQN